VSRPPDPADTEELAEALRLVVVLKKHGNEKRITRPSGEDQLSGCPSQASLDDGGP
jgi:hypothetical protein